MENSQNPMKSFWLEHESKIVLCFGLILVAAVSFEFGFVQGGKNKSAAIVIEKPLQGSQAGLGQGSGATIDSSDPQAQKASEREGVTPGAIPVANGNCAFVGSKNSNKFYPPNCSYAKRIKPENVICFTSAQEAISQGRTQSAGCAQAK